MERRFSGKITMCFGTEQNRLITTVSVNTLASLFIRCSLKLSNYPLFPLPNLSNSPITAFSYLFSQFAHEISNKKLADKLEKKERLIMHFGIGLQLI
jgi:hypothetical protein